ncbi:MAG: metallophosphoesterase [Clostridia bacterium]|nr:metallophosphoesterase [Clostridia bacterium]
MTNKELRYLTDHYDEKIETINRLCAPLNFIFITDQHNELVKSVVPVIESMQYILDRCPGIHFLVSGGDIGNDYNPDPNGMRASHIRIMEAMYSLGIPVHCCIGNHDDGLGNMIAQHWDNRNAILPDEMHRICGKYNPTNRNYYYTDIDTEGGDYRLVFLDCTDKPYLTDANGQYPYGWRLEISDEQAEWFENNVLNTDRGIFVFSHSPLSNAGIYGTANMTDRIKPYDDLLGSPRLTYHVRVCKRVLALFSGHVHYDNVHYDGDLPQITTNCALLQKWAPGCPERTAGTITETAFDVVSVKGDTVYLTRFGPGTDRCVDLIRARSTMFSRNYIHN